MTKTLILDYKKWQCGKPERTNDKARSHGKGQTALLNKDDYSCCLGQFSKQLVPSLISEDMLNIGRPEDIIQHAFKLDPLIKITNQAIAINDNKTTSIKEKVNNLRKLMLTINYTLKPINFPKRFNI